MVDVEVFEVEVMIRVFFGVKGGAEWLAVLFKEVKEELDITCGDECVNAVDIG